MDISDLELKARYEDVFEKYVTKAPELAKILEEYGRVRKELAALLVEMKKRNMTTETEKNKDAPKHSR